MAGQRQKERQFIDQRGQLPGRGDRRGMASRHGPSNPRQAPQTEDAAVFRGSIHGRDDELDNEKMPIAKNGETRKTFLIAAPSQLATFRRVTKCAWHCARVQSPTREWPRVGSVGTVGFAP